MHHISYPIITRKNRERKKDTRNVRETSINNLTMTSDFFSDNFSETISEKAVSIYNKYMLLLCYSRSTRLLLTQKDSS